MVHLTNSKYLFSKTFEIRFIENVPFIFLNQEVLYFAEVAAVFLRGLGPFDNPLRSESTSDVFHLYILPINIACKHVRYERSETRVVRHTFYDAILHTLLTGRER